ncbi:MAG: DNA primase [Bacteroidota bacterium]
MYKESTINLVREADITKVIGNYADLKRAGSLYECKSPLNPNEKSPSFKVSPAKNNFVCYSTQHSGDGIKFVMLKENCNFIEAIEKIAGICNIFLEREEETEEVKQKRSEKEQLLKLMDWASKKYQKELANLPTDNWSKEMVSNREINEETILTFGIGYAPTNWNFLTNTVVEHGKLELAKTTEIVSVKDGKAYDFFNNRLMFPIQDVNGNVIAFGGRCSKEEEGKTAKYINSRETSIYSKTATLYGLFQAKNAIAKSRTAVLTEGYTDVTSLHQNGCDIAIASCGTALTDSHCKLLSRFAAHVIICRDNDGFDEKGNPKAGTKATLKDIDISLKHGFKVSVVIFPEGEDPDSQARNLSKEITAYLSIEGNTIESEDCPKNISEYIFANAKDAVLWKTEFLKNQAANDPDKISECVSEVSKMIFQIKDDVKRGLYLKDCAKALKQPMPVLKGMIEKLASEAIEKSLKKPSTTSAEDLGLPPGADFEEFKKHRYITLGNSCWFQNRGGTFSKGTNYRLTPLFHVYGKNDNKRLCEVINESGSKKLIDFDSTAFVSRNKFDEALINEGFFVNLENFSAVQFTLMRNRILSDFIMAFELKTLGWQKEGFFAFANCVYFKGIIKDVNQYGIVQIETDNPDTSEYFEEVKHYYSPAFSEIYKHTRDDDDPYENDRYFVYKKAPIAIHTWMNQLKKVYGDKSTTGIAFIIASMFRDIYIKRYQFFPHLFLTGEKGSGKSKFGESLSAMFTYKQEPFDLNSGTPVAFYRRLSRITNAPTMLEEFHDNVEDKIFQSLKGAYDGRGREMGKATGDNRTTTTKVNSSLIILSQYLSSRDDNSLTSRSVIEHFIKPQESFTNEQLQEYNLLKSWEEEGLSSMLVDVLEHRKYVEDNLHQTYAEINKQLKKELQGIEYQERMLQNYVALMTPIKLLFDKIKFPFTYNEIYKQFKEAIIDSSDLIVESEGLAEFWRTLEYLLDRQPYPLLVKDTHFKIEKFGTLQLQTRKGEKDHEWVNTNKKQVLMLRLNAVHQLYHKEVSTREGVDVIGENTLRNYFKSKKYYIGSVKSHNFSDTSTSAYVFDYSMMEHGGILNLIRKEKGAEQTIFDKDPENDLPY